MADPLSRTDTTGYRTPAIRDYVQALFSPTDRAFEDALDQLAAMDMPQIQVSPTDGKILHVLLALVRAQKVVEFGTLSGYSGLWILKALGPKGHLWTCEDDPKHARVARGVFERAGYREQVTILEGPGLSSLGSLTAHAPFDAVFIDADKVGYAGYARWAYEHLRPGGLIIGDNTYLFGYLAGQSADARWNRQAIDAMRQFQEFVAAHCVSVCLPTPDGMTVGMKPYAD